MTPAEYAKAQGWRVGDLLWLTGSHACVVILRHIGAAELLLEWLEDGYQECCVVVYPQHATPDDKRIGRVLRPEGR